MAYASKIKTTDEGIIPIGSNLLGTCATASGTAAKVVTLADFDVLTVGVTVHVKFTNSNTASNPTLKVGGTSAVPIYRNGSASGVWTAGATVSFTYDGTYWNQNDADDSGKTYGLSYDSTTNSISLVEGGGSDSVTVTDDNTTYTLTKSGNTITLTGSDGSTTSVTDANTTYSAMTQAQGEAGTSTANMVISPKILHGVIEALDNDTTYTISKSGNTVTLTGSDGSTSSFTDSDTTYTAETATIGSASGWLSLIHI